MPEPAFLVEGQMEQKIIEKICPGKIVRRIGCNGDKVEMKAVARFIDAQMRRLKNYSPIIIIFDRERRRQSCSSLKLELAAELDARGHVDRYIIGIPDRTTENWILADWQSVCSSRSDFKTFEGCAEQLHGKSELRKLLPTGHLFTETTLGPELFLLTSAQRVYERSPSFRDLVDMLNFPCKWLSRIDDRFRFKKPLT